MQISATRSSGKTAGSNASAGICADHRPAVGRVSVGYRSSELDMWLAEFTADCFELRTQALFGAADGNRLAPTSDIETRTM